ncbi:MAG: hypothetical protein LBQ56_07210 [Synergistaceae bacterium]|nr:hypothetical protein [Synergistaceae bacterium]
MWIPLPGLWTESERFIGSADGHGRDIFIKDGRATDGRACYGIVEQTAKQSRLFGGSALI